jgi:hypothetical protein
MKGMEAMEEEEEVEENLMMMMIEGRKTKIWEFIYTYD